MPSRSTIAVLCTIICCAPAPTISQEADDRGFPRVSGNIINRLGYNGDYDSESPRIESNDTFVEVVASPVFHFSEKFRFITETRVETIMPPDRDRFFEDQGYFARILLAEYSFTDQLSINLGKMTPSFALASFVTPGMFGNSYNREIELIDQVGVGGAYVFGESGDKTLRFNTFFEDTSVFSESFGNGRGRTSIFDGGASNTEGLDSFALSLQGNNIERFPGLTYQLGAVYRARGVDGVADEKGVSLSLLQTREAGNGAKLTFIGELAALENFEGTDDNIVYATAGFSYQSGRWTSVISGTYRPRNVAGGENFDDYSVQTALAYDIGQGISFEIAHEFNRDENANNKRLGLRLIKIIDLGK